MEDNKLEKELTDFSFTEDMESQELTQKEKEEAVLDNLSDFADMEMSKDSARDLEEAARIREIIEEEARINANDKSKQLYIVCDRHFGGLLTYCRERKLRVSKIISSLKEAKELFTTKTNDLRIVIIEAGTGTFLQTENRADLVAIASLVKIEGLEVSIFFTDTLIRAECEKKLEERDFKKIDWHKYKSILITIATVLSYYEDYKLAEGSQLDSDYIIASETIKESEYALDEQTECIIDKTKLMERMKQDTSEEETLEEFKIEL